MDAHLVQVGFVVLMLLCAALNLFSSRLVARSTATTCATPFRLAALGGALGGCFGVGASVVAVPVLTGVFGFSQVAAQGMALSLALPSSLITLITYGMEGNVDWSMGAAMALGGLFSVSLGVRLAYRAPEKLLCGLFSCFLAGSAALLLIRA